MRKRTRARELALQLLYQVEITRGEAGGLIEDFFSLDVNKNESAEVKDFARELVINISGRMAVIDKKLSACATNWQLERMAVIDRNILRLAAFELLFREDIPIKVAINEAVDLAKKYGDLESGRFVNGILDEISKQRNLRHPSA